MDGPSRKVFGGAAEHVVEDEDVVALGEQVVDEVGANEARPAGDGDAQALPRGYNGDGGRVERALVDL
jgi:hypothetical protein